MTAKQENSAFRNEESSSNPTQGSARKVILEADYEELYNALGYCPKNWETLGEFSKKPYDKVDCEYEVELKKIAIPSPFVYLNMGIYRSQDRLSGWLTLRASQQRGITEELNKGLSLEAEKRNLLWKYTPTEKAGRIIPAIAPIQGDLESIAKLSYGKVGERSSEYYVMVGRENGCEKMWPLRDVNDFKTRVSPLLWITETIINTRLRINNGTEASTRGTDIYPIRLNMPLD